MVISLFPGRGNLANSQSKTQPWTILLLDKNLNQILHYTRGITPKSVYKNYLLLPGTRVWTGRTKLPVSDQPHFGGAVIYKQCQISTICV